MSPGDLIFVSGTDLISLVIRWVTKSKYSHVAIYVGDGKVIEAQVLRRVGFKRLSYYAGKYDIKSIPLTDKQRMHGLLWLLHQRGRTYSYWTDIVILIRRLFNIKIPWHEGISIICSRLGRDFLFRCGLSIPDENMSPEDLWEWVTQYSVRR